MAKATNSPESKIQFESEATNGKTAVQELPKQEKITTEDSLTQMKEWLKANPEFVKSIVGQTQQTAPVFTPAPPIEQKQVEAENLILVLANKKKKGDVIIDLIDDVYDAKTGKTRRMRIVRGASSVWQDEQVNLPKEHIAKNQVTLHFSRGRCIIPFHETLKVEAALKSNRNLDNPNKVGHKDIYFNIWNPAKLDKIEEQKQARIIEAMQIAATADMKDLIPHAQYLGIQFNDEMGKPLGDSSLRTLYSKKAMNEPDKFLNSIHSPVVKMAHLVRKALNEGKIDMGRQPNQAFWTDGGFITALPEGRDSVEYLVEFAMVSGEANERFVSQIRSFNE